jgi:hypothetical protein
MSQADAYRSAYAAKNMSDKTIHEAASRLVADSKVSARLAEDLVFLAIIYILHNSDKLVKTGN